MHAQCTFPLTNLVTLSRVTFAFEIELLHHQPAKHRIVLYGMRCLCQGLHITGCLAMRMDMPYAHGHAHCEVCMITWCGCHAHIKHAHGMHAMNMTGAHWLHTCQLHGFAAKPQMNPGLAHGCTKPVATKTHTASKSRTEHM